MTDEQDWNEPVVRDGVEYWPCVPGVNPETGEWACGICGAPGEQDCIEEEHRIVEVVPKAQLEDTWFDKWLDDNPEHWYADFYMFKVLPFEMRVRRFFRFKRNFRDWRFERQFKPGGYFLDHGTDPAVITEVTDAVRGVSLVSGRGVVSDFYACGPVVTNQKAAWVAATRLRNDHFKFSDEQKKRINNEIGWPPNGKGFKDLIAMIEEMWSRK